MKQFYIDTDLRENCFYIACLKVNAEHIFLIQFKERYKADQLLKKLQAGLVMPPQNPEDPTYQLIKVVEEERGKVFIYRWQGGS